MGWMTGWAKSNGCGRWVATNKCAESEPDVGGVVRREGRRRATVKGALRRERCGCGSGAAPPAAPASSARTEDDDYTLVKRANHRPTLTR